MADDDFLQTLGVSALGSRLRRLFEMLNTPVSELYRRELGFEQRWFALSMLLDGAGPTSVQDAANRLGTSHVSVLQIAKAMESAGVLHRRKDPSDARRVLLELTDHGLTLMRDAKRVSRRVDRAARRLLEEAAPDFLNGLTQLENAIRRKSFGSRLEQSSRRPSRERRSDEGIDP